MMKVTLNPITRLIILGTCFLVASPSAVLSLTTEEVEKIAQQITVKIDGTDAGSGAIVNKEGNTYTVVTNCHVVKNPGDYTIETYTGEVITIQITGNKTYCHSQADIAEIKFTSNQNYPKVQLWDSTRLKQGDVVYVSGWKGNSKYSQGQRRYRFAKSRIVGLDQQARDGYSIAYSGFSDSGGESQSNPEPGMSGGPILDSQARLVAINGLFVPNVTTGGKLGEFLAVPVNTYTAWKGIQVVIPNVPPPPKIIGPENPSTGCISASGQCPR